MASPDLRLAPPHAAVPPLAPGHRLSFPPPAAFRRPPPPHALFAGAPSSVALPPRRGLLGAWRADWGECRVARCSPVSLLVRLTDPSFVFMQRSLFRQRRSRSAEELRQLFLHHLWFCIISGFASYALRSSRLQSENSLRLRAFSCSSSAAATGFSFVSFALTCFPPLSLPHMRRARFSLYIKTHTLKWSLCAGSHELWNRNYMSLLPPTG